MPSYTPNQINKDEMINRIREKMLNKNNNITSDQRKKFKGSLKNSIVKDFLVDLLLIKENTINHQDDEIHRLREENKRLQAILTSRN